MMEEYRLELGAGTELFRQGDLGDCAYIIEQGEVLISSTDSTGNELELAVLGPGSVVGEMALIDGRPRTATARVTQTAEMVVIPKSHFSRLMEESDPTVNMLIRVVLQRYRELVGGSKPAPQRLDTKSEFFAQATLAAERIARESDLFNAIKNNNMHLFYQPIIDLKTERIVGCEALIRWLDPERGLIPPNRFITLAEESGLIVPIGHIVFQQAYATALELERTLGEKLWVSVNLSGRQIADDRQVEILFDLIEKQGIDLSYLKIEITESLLLSNQGRVGDILNRFKSLGAQISLDDFGTGYSSFSYLHRFPIDTIKIDQSFVFTMDSNPKSDAIVRSLCSLAQSLDIATVAEGVEKADDESRLREFHCDYSQGYLYSQPVPLMKFIDVVRDYAASVIQRRAPALHTASMV